MTDRRSTSSERRQLVHEIRAISEDITMAFIPSKPAAWRALRGPMCPEPRVIPTTALRRLRQALVEFRTEALAAEERRESRRTGRT